MNGLCNRVGSLWLLVMLLFVWNESAAATTSVQRCCPPGYAFVVLADVEEDTGDFFTHRFRCRERSGQEGEPTRLFGYNLDVTNQTIGIPQCSEVIMSNLGSAFDLVSTESCLDELNGQVIALRCSVDERSIDVHRVLKCCPEGSSYDLNERKCVFNNVQQLDVFSHLAGEAVVLFDVKTPQCLDNEEVFIEYLSETHRLRLHQSSIDVVSVKHEQSEHLSPYSFCIEALQTNQSTIEDALFSDPSPPHPLIVRTCRPRSICNRMPCVRRCCRNEQMFELHNDDSICVQNENHLRPTFYNVMYPLAADKPQTVVDPPGMTINYSKTI